MDKYVNKPMINAKTYIYFGTRAFWPSVHTLITNQDIVYRYDLSSDVEINYANSDRRKCLKILEKKKVEGTHRHRDT